MTYVVSPSWMRLSFFFGGPGYIKHFAPILAKRTSRRVMSGLISWWSRRLIGFTTVLVNSHLFHVRCRLIVDRPLLLMRQICLSGIPLHPIRVLTSHYQIQMTSINLFFILIQMHALSATGTAFHPSASSARMDKIGGGVAGMRAAWILALLIFNRCYCFHAAVWFCSLSTVYSL